MSQSGTTAGIGSPAVQGAYMAGIIFIAAAGIFAIGIAAGIVAVVSHGIRRERKRFRQERRFRDEHGISAGPDGWEYFLVEAPDPVSRAARRLNGLYVRRLHTAARDANRDPGVPV